MTFVIGFSGTQVGMTEAQKNKFVEEFCKIQDMFPDKKLEFHHGDDEGSDSDADELVRFCSRSCEIHIHPPVNENRRAFCNKRGPTVVHEAKKFLVRNNDIAYVCNMLIAIVKERYEMRRSGTWSTVRRARRYNKPIIFIYPDGNIRDEKVYTTSMP